MVSFKCVMVDLDNTLWPGVLAEGDIGAGEQLISLDLLYVFLLVFLFFRVFAFERATMHTKLMTIKREQVGELMTRLRTVYCSR